MSLRLDCIARIGWLGAWALLACSSEDAPSGGTAGSAGTSGASATAGSGGAGGSAAGSSSGGSGGDGMSGGGSAGAEAGSGGSGGDTAGSGGSGGGGGSGGSKSKTTFFVTSDTVQDGNLGGLEGADMRCTQLATAAGFGDHTWRAYLSTSTVNAKDRIGTGPWVNSKGVTLAESVAALHEMDGNAELFLDEKGQKINGQWDDSPQPNQHDILTGTNADGTKNENTCSDWTSASNDVRAQVGHSDGLGPRMNGMANPNPPYNSWSSVHTNQGCGNLTPGGGAGKIYCFAID